MLWGMRELFCVKRVLSQLYVLSLARLATPLSLTVEVECLETQSTTVFCGLPAVEGNYNATTLVNLQCFSAMFFFSLTRRYIFCLRRSQTVGSSRIRCISS